ncbi:hypothetical protein [Streptomyces sp. NPDC088752]
MPHPRGDASIRVALVGSRRAGFRGLDNDILVPVIVTGCVAT